MTLPFSFLFGSNLFPSRRVLLLRDLDILLYSSVTYIRLGGILLLSQIFCDLHPFKGSCRSFGFVSNLHPPRQNLVT